MNTASRLSVLQHPATSIILSVLAFLCIGAGMGLVFEPVTGLISPAIIGIAALIPASIRDAKHGTASPLALKVCTMIVCAPLGVIGSLIALR